MSGIYRAGVATLVLVLGVAGVVLGAVALFRVDPRFAAAGVICIGLALVLPALT